MFPELVIPLLDKSKKSPLANSCIWLATVLIINGNLLAITLILSYVFTTTFALPDLVNTGRY
jgi:hypothetical protein